MYVFFNCVRAGYKNVGYSEIPIRKAEIGIPEYCSI